MRILINILAFIIPYYTTGMMVLEQRKDYGVPLGSQDFNDYDLVEELQYMQPYEEFDAMVECSWLNWGFWCFFCRQRGPIIPFVNPYTPDGEDDAQG